MQQDSCARSNQSSIIKCDERDCINSPSMYNMNTDMQSESLNVVQKNDQVLDS